MLYNEQRRFPSFQLVCLSLGRLHALLMAAVTMGDQEACGSFAPQVFRKNLCQTCFQPQDAHGKAPG